MTTFNSYQEYKVAMQRAEELIAKATEAGGFEKLPKEEVDEFGNIGAAASKYELEVLKIYPFTGKSTNELVLQIEAEMFHRRMKQKEMASFLGVSTSRFCDILNGKTSITLKLAKALHKKLGFDGNFILSSV